MRYAQTRLRGLPHMKKGDMIIRDLIIRRHAEHAS